MMEAKEDRCVIPTLREFETESSSTTPPLTPTESVVPPKSTTSNLVVSTSPTRLPGVISTPFVPKRRGKDSDDKEKDAKTDNDSPTYDEETQHEQIYDEHGMASKEPQHEQEAPAASKEPRSIL